MAGDGDTMAHKTIMPKRSLPRRLTYFVVIHMIQTYVRIGYFLSAKLKPPKVQPDRIMTYPCRKKLPIHIYYPPNYNPPTNVTTTKYPTLFTIHGGGFVLGKPDDTSNWCRRFATAHSVLVIALNYAKAPASPFPGPIHDLEALTLACLSDSSLPIDASRLAVAGWSAGGNLALGIAQLPSLRAHFKAVIPIYAACDLATPTMTKASTRPYKPELGGLRAQSNDLLESAAGLFDWSYCPVGQDLSDPLLSPLYAPHENFPPHIFFVSCELDLLAHEAWRLACKLGGKPQPAGDIRVGRQDVGKMGELEMVDERFFWECGGYRWLLVPDAIHGYDSPMVDAIEKRDKAAAEDMRAKDEKVRALVGEWLFKGPWKE